MDMGHPYLFRAGMNGQRRFDGCRPYAKHI